MLCARIADAGTAVGSSPQWPEWSRALATHIAEAVRAKQLVLIAESMIQAHIERILVIHLILICQIVVGQASLIRRRIEIGDVEADLVDQCRIDDVWVA